MLGEEAGALVTVTGPLEDFEQKLAGPDGAKWREEFKLFLRKENRWPIVEMRPEPTVAVADLPNFPIWRTLAVGNKSGDALLAELKARRFKVSEEAEKMIECFSFVVSPEPREVDLVLATVRELGFSRHTTTRALWKRIEELGSLCPPDLGPHLRLDYSDQIFGEGVAIAMDPITSYRDMPRVFWLDYDSRDGCGGRDGRDGRYGCDCCDYRNSCTGRDWWLFGFGKSQDTFWSFNDRVVFVRPRKTA